jgi:ACS family glucarate transporter-like MFS transporter
MLFIATTVNYADRSTLSIAGAALQAQLGISVVAMGYLYQHSAGRMSPPKFPGAGCWIASDRGGSMRPASSCGRCSRSPRAPFACSRAAAIFNSAQYFATVAFVPIMAWITHQYGWQLVYLFMGMTGLALLALWSVTVYSPRQHPRVTHGELDFIAAGGAQVDMYHVDGRSIQALTWARVTLLPRSRMLIGVYLGQYGITTLTYFFLTWFPIYLIRQRGMSMLAVGFVATLPAICGFVGGVLGAVFSDGLLRRGFSLTAARKVPIVLGMLISTVIIACNYVRAYWLVVLLIWLAFFGKGVGALGWAVVADTSPRQMAALSSALFNTFGNLAAITAAIAIGYIVARSGSFAGASLFVAANAVVAIVSYLLIVGPIGRLELTGG